MQAQLSSTSWVLGTDLYDEKNTGIGTVRDILFDLSTGRINFLIISSGSALGLDEQYYVVPFELFHIDSSSKKLVLNDMKVIGKELPKLNVGTLPQYYKLFKINDLSEYMELLKLFDNGDGHSTDR